MGKPCLATFYNKMARFVNKGRTAESVYVGFGEIFTTALVSKF